MDAAWIFVVIAALVVLVALMVYVLPPRRDQEDDAAAAPAGGPSSSSGSLARGFGYLHVSSHRTSRRGGVSSRLDRAIGRIDAVDPHANSRRIGEALLQGGLTETAAAPPTPTTQPSVLWVDPPVEQPRDSR